MQLQPGEVERFREVQPMHRNVLIRYLVPIEAVVVSAIILPLGLTRGGADQTTLLVIWFLCAIVLPLGIAFGFRLTTVVTDRRLVATFRPFVSKKIDLDQIESAEAVKYSPLMDAGGWGVKHSRKFGSVLNVAGEHGVFVRYTKNGKPKKMLVGSEHPGEIADAVGKPPAGDADAG